MDKTVGIIGLGIMGGAFARHLVGAGWHVVGRDIDAARCEEASGLGVEVAEDAAAVARKAGTILTVLPNASALHSVVREITGSGAARRIVVEMGTFSLADKLQAQQSLADAGHVMLDCPVTGTGVEARAGDVVVFVSGDAAIGATLRPMFDAFSREAHHVGPFGNGTRMKFVTNHLAAIHVAAAGEAMALGMKAGLDPRQILQLATAGGADSRMLRLRGPMMVEGRYDGPNISARTSILAKDTVLIGRFADDLGCPVPMLGAAKALFVAALATGHADEDTASVCAVSEQMAGSPRGTV
jgi:putative dehydrogenase